MRVPFVKNYFEKSDELIEILKKSGFYKECELRQELNSESIIFFDRIV